jgi:hypothetical protein
MANDTGLVSQTLIERFEPYVKHSDQDHHALREGDRAVACKNVKAALAWLGVARAFGDDPDLFDDELSKAVQRFQKDTGHKNIDGVVGPGTRAKLVSQVLQKCGVSQFDKLDGADAIRIPAVFLSYAWADASRVDKLDQWLRDHGVRVIRDVDFEPGSNIKDNIWTSVFSADKVIAVYSAHSQARDWPSFERQIAEEVERLIQTSVLIYLCLDDTPLKAHDPHRIAIKGRTKTLRQIGAEILKALHVPVEPARFEYDEDEPL